jgi:hypothetical protein
MANCKLCNRETKTAGTCNVAVLHHMGRPYLLRTHEPEPGRRPLDERCFDCGVEVGGFHHLGCEVQACPQCDDDAVWCGCLWDEFIHAYLAAGLLEGEHHDELEALVRAAFARFLRSLAPTSGALSHA